MISLKYRWCAPKPQGHNRKQFGLVPVASIVMFLVLKIMKTQWRKNPTTPHPPALEFPAHCVPRQDSALLQSKCPGQTPENPQAQQPGLPNVQSHKHLQVGPHPAVEPAAMRILSGTRSRARWHIRSTRRTSTEVVRMCDRFAEEFWQPQQQPQVPK